MQLDATIIQRFKKPDLWLKLGLPLFILVSLYLLAKLVWLWADAFTADYKIAPVATPQERPTTTTANVSVEAIVSKHLFGDVTAKPIEQPVVEVAATETRLPLKLRGIYASSEEDRASAIIESGGDQDVYFIGDKINGGRGAVLHQVQATKVILNTSGQLESLTLEQEDSVIAMDRGPAALKTDERAPAEGPKSENIVVDNPRIQQELTDIRKKLQTDPASLKDMLRWEPVMENGVIQGVKISPGKARRLFYELKLRRNDIVTNINGIPLNDPGQLLMLKDTLASAQEVSLTLLRNGQSQDVTIQLGGAER
ncbi:MAG: type II secretion system protein GspC [Gammaproteobacteria bacterium]|nr:type II secretion system protein GspC [Gammaproteobacteria bacterium]